MLADSFEGKRLNAPNDIVVKSDDSIWFTDPLFGINGEWEGTKEKPEQATTNVYRIGKDGKLTAVITDLVNPNGLAFSPDEKKLYVVEWKGTPNRSIWSYDVGADGSAGQQDQAHRRRRPGRARRLPRRPRRQSVVRLGQQRRAAVPSRPTSAAARCIQLKGKSGGPRRRDGVQPARAEPIGFIRLPERCANLALRRPQEQPPLHDELPFGLRALRRSARRGVSRECAVARGVLSRGRLPSCEPTTPRAMSCRRSHLASSPPSPPPTARTHRRSRLRRAG